MSGITINSYDFNITPTENLKANFLADRMAKNRWGNEFVRLFRRYGGVDPVDNTIGIYSFTAGMIASFAPVSQYESDLFAAENFRTKLLSHFRVEVDGIFSIDGALKHSYLSVLIERMDNGTATYPITETRGVHFSLSLEGDAGKKTSWFHSSGVNDGSVCELEKLEKESDTFGLYLESDDGLFYGHYDDGLRSGSVHSEILNMYGIEDKTDEQFNPDQDSLFLDIWAELIVFSQMMAKENAPDIQGERVSVVIGLNQLVDFMNERIFLLKERITAMEESTVRHEEDLDLINHLELQETLHEEIEDPNKISSIWFEFKKEIFPSPLDEGGVDQSHEWWKETQFDEIRENVDNFQDYCIVIWGTGIQGLTPSPSYVEVNAEIFDHAGHKVYWFVSAFLNVDLNVKSRSFWETLLNIILTVVAIVLIVISKNPVWMKLLLVSTTVMNFAGVLSPEIALAVAVLTFGYGIYNVDISGLSGTEMFRLAIKNVDMIFNMVEMHDAIGLKKEKEAQVEQDNKNKSTAQIQEDAMTFLYSTAYNQYNEMYELLYDFSPKYRF